MPKAYDHERGNFVDVERTEVLPPETQAEFGNSYIWGRQVRIGLTEALGGLSIFYLVCIASFNAGYFSSVSGRFVELFSFSDVVGTNIPILQYFLVVYSAYSALGLIHSLALNNLFKPVRERLDDAILASFYWTDRRTRIFWMGFFLTFISLSSILDDKRFNLAIAPYLFFQGFVTLPHGLNPV